MFRTTLFAMVLFWIPFAALKSARKDRRHSMLPSVVRPLRFRWMRIGFCVLSAIGIPNEEGAKGERGQRDESFLVALLSSRAINGGAFLIYLARQVDSTPPPLSLSITHPCPGLGSRHEGGDQGLPLLGLLLRHGGLLGGKVLQGGEDVVLPVEVVG